MSWWRRLVPVRSARDIAAPTYVRVEGPVVSGNDVASPATGITAALIRWVVVAERTFDGNQQAAPGAHISPIASGFFGESLEILADDTRIEIAATHRLRLRIALDLQGGSPIPPTLPAEIAAVIGRAPVQNGVLHYVESHLRRGDLVRLEGYVGPTGSPGGAYRGTGGARLAALAELGEVTLTDLSVER